jgi:CHAD domain-containing protein
MKPLNISEYACEQTSSYLKQFLAQRRRAAESIHDEESIHDLRVSIRRLQQCLRTFRDLWAAEPAKKIRKRLRKLMALCAAVRNCDVALGVLREAGVESGERKRKLLAIRKGAELALGEHLRDRRRWKKKKWIKHLLLDPQQDTQWFLQQHIQNSLIRILPGLAGDFFAAGGIAAKQANLESLHQFRLHAKRFRYTLELFRPFYGNEIKDCLQQLRELQDHLGEVNDCVTAVSLLAGDREAATAIQRLLLQRDAKFRRYWRQFSVRRETAWRDWLSRPGGVTE